MSQAMPSIAASDQTLNQLSTRVVVPSAVSDGPGWVTIHEASGGTAGAPIGRAHLDAGANPNVTVTLDRPAVDGETLYAMLHADRGTVGAYEYPGVDAPVSVGGENVMGPFVVTVAAGTPAVRFHVSGVGTSAYVFSQVEPAAFAGMLESGGNNPTLTFRTGWRYEIVNAVFGMHPFQLLERGATPAADTVLLSEAGAGSLETDAAIDWREGNQGVMRFTLAPSLAAVLTGYRCSVHPSVMRGAVAIE